MGKKIRKEQIEGLDGFIKTSGGVFTGPTYYDTGNAMTVLYPAQSVIKDSRFHDTNGYFVAFQCTTPLNDLRDLDFECDLTIRNTGVKRAEWAVNYPENNRQNSADKIKVVFSTDERGYLNDRKPLAHVESSLLDYKGKQIKVGIDAGKITIFVAYKAYNSEFITATLDCVQVTGRSVRTEWNIFSWQNPAPVNAVSSYIYHGSDKDLVRDIENIKAEFFHSRQSVIEYETDLLDDNDKNKPLAMIKTYGLGIKLSSWELLNFVDDGKFEFLIERYRPQKRGVPNRAWVSPDGEESTSRYGRAKYKFEPEDSAASNGRINVITARVGGDKPFAYIHDSDAGSYLNIQPQGTFLFFNQPRYFLWEKKWNKINENFPVVKSYPRKYGRIKEKESEDNSSCISSAFCWLGFKLRFRLRGKEYVTRGHIGQIKMVAKAISEIKFKGTNVLDKDIFCVISYRKG